MAARRVSRRFGELTAVDDVSIEVCPGEVVGLIGANGAGKTTLIRMLLGLLPASAGQVALFGGTPSRRSRRRVGYVPQGLGLYVDMTVDENVAFVAAAFGGRTRSTGVLGPELARIGDDLVGEIGLGRQRQLAFACARGHHPDVLVLDEPTSGVDPLARARLWDQIRSESDGGTGVLVTTHYMQEAQQCDRLVIMVAGRVAASGSYDEIVGPQRVVEVTSADWTAAFTVLSRADLPVTLSGRRVRVADTGRDEVAARLDAAGVEATIRHAPATLDDVMVLLSRGVVTGP